MKKLLILTAAAFFFTGVGFAHDVDKDKGKEKGKKATPKSCPGKQCGKKKDA